MVLALFIGLVYFYFKTGLVILLFIAAICMILFFVLIKVHDRVKFEKRIDELFVTINQEELNFLNENQKPFYNGDRYLGSSHNYTHDLDIFGVESMYHHINRCYSFIGQNVLADLFKDPLASNSIIIERQNAIKELQEKVNWRQKFTALSRVEEDKKEYYDFVVKWAETPPIKLSNLINVLSYVMPVVFLCFFVYVVFFNAQNLFSFLGILLIANMAVLGSQLKKIKDSLNGSEKLSRILKQYALLITHIEEEKFKSIRLNQLKSALSKNGIQAQQQFRQLSKLFSEMDSLDNFMASLIFNGSCLYHLHRYRALNKWKESYSEHIKNWLQIIGEFETTSSLANFGYNNPEFSCPKLNDKFDIAFENLGHPLLKKSVRVDNSIDFENKKFIILTGSNMSGKSTFLRSLGVNLILTQMGAVVCADQAHVHPLKLLVSMRAEDSLADDESYFFAEVKRLKFLIDQVADQKCFVLLDEILRGTNSSDKRAGTIGYIKKLVAHKTIGAIATHDLEVCQTAHQHPQYLTNKCFEVEIVEDNLQFDYKLKDGICQNQSATFLMNKMEII